MPIDEDFYLWLLQFVTFSFSMYLFFLLTNFFFFPVFGEFKIFSQKLIFIQTSFMLLDTFCTLYQSIKVSAKHQNCGLLLNLILKSLSMKCFAFYKLYYNTMCLLLLQTILQDYLLLQCSKLPWRKKFLVVEQNPRISLRKYCLVLYFRIFKEWSAYQFC